MFSTSSSNLENALATVTPTRTPSTSPPGGPTAFTFTDEFDFNTLLDCTGDGDLAIVTIFTATITTVNNCSSLTPTNVTTSYAFTIDYGGSCNYGPETYYINSGNQVQWSYERGNGCLGTLCDATVSSVSPSLTEC